MAMLTTMLSGAGASSEHVWFAATVALLPLTLKFTMQPALSVRLMVESSTFWKVTFSPMRLKLDTGIGHTGTSVPVENVHGPTNFVV